MSHKLTCPIAPVHSRLNDAHRLWHAALENYQDPEAFRTYLNACIEALRNVTFVLQKNGSAIAGFGAWYPGWQDRMRGDVLMRWLVEARNQVVKEGDLNTRSTTHVTLLDRYIQGPILELDVDSRMTLDEIADAIDLGQQSEHTRTHGWLVIERKWVAEDLPTNELLDALGYVFGVLRDLVADAHRQSGFDDRKALECDGGIPFQSEHEPSPSVSRLPCMTANEKERSVRIRLSTGETGLPRYKSVKTSTADLESARQRYGDTPAEFTRRNDQTQLRSLAEYFFSMGQRMLVVDGYHHPIALLGYPDGRTMPVQVMAADRGEKYMIMHEVAALVRKTGANSIIFITESWFARFDPSHPDFDASKAPDRLEVLALTALGADGEAFSWHTAFSRAEMGQSFSTSDSKSRKVTAAF